MKRFTLLAAVASLVLVACADDEPTPVAVGDDDSTAVIVTTTTEPPTAATTAPPPTTSPPATDTADTSETTDVTEATDATTTTTTTTPTTTTTVPVVGEPEVATELVAEFAQPVDLAVRPGDDALYVVEQGGRVIRWSGDTTVVADIGDLVSGGGEQGLLGLAFAPDGSLAYVNYTDRGGDTIVTEYPVGGDGNLDLAAGRVVIEIDQPFRNHNAGDLEFGPDGMLYIPLGDGGSGGDPERNGDDPTTLLGSLLRIDPAPTGDAPYTVPADNPFADGPFEGIEGAPEVWAWGLRNPWKIAFDPVTGDLWIPDVGQNAIEEVNVLAPVDGATAGRGADFGWSAFEGTDRFNTDVADTGRTTMPVLTYRHGNDGCSISGGQVYRGSAIAELEPAFVYSDFCSGILWALDLAGARNLTLLRGLSEVAAIRSGPDGELYVLERSGDLLRLVPG